jgi:hypothetical protein
VNGFSLCRLLNLDPSLNLVKWHGVGTMRYRHW